MSVTTQTRAHRRLALVVIGVAQLMVVMNATVTSVAIPSIQRDLGVSDIERAWLLIAYALVFGSCLVVGGSISDRLGARRAFIFASAGFAASALAAGTAVAPTQLFASLGAEGLFAAVLVPSGVSKLSSTFTEPRARSRALGVYSAIAASGAAIGLLIGGVLTEYLTWRSCCMMPLPFALIAGVGARFALAPDAPNRRRPINAFGALLLTTGLTSMILGASSISSSGLTGGLTVIPLISGVALLALFALHERRSKTPLLSRAVVAGLDKVTAMLAMAMSAVAMQSVFLFLTLFEQDVLRMTPLETGLSFLPLPITIALVSTQITARLLHQLPPIVLIVPGTVCVLLGCLGLSWIEWLHAYGPEVIVTLVLVGAGQALIAFPCLTALLHGAPAEQTGLASAMQAASQQIGGAIGIAGLNAIAVSFSASLSTPTAVSGVSGAEIIAAASTMVVLLLVVRSWVTQRRTRSAATST